MSDRWRTMGWAMLGVALVVLASPLRAETPEALIERIRSKLRETSSIYLEGTLRTPEGEGDTTTVILAYQYPDRLLEIVRGSKRREQILIFHGNEMAIRYPHLDLEKTQTLSPAQRNELLLKTVPLAGVVAGLRRSDSVPYERMSVSDREGQRTLTVTDPFGAASDYRTARLVFEAETLHPRYLELEGTRRYQMRIITYEEEKRFPPAIEQAMMEMNPKVLDSPTS